MSGIETKWWNSAVVRDLFKQPDWHTSRLIITSLSLPLPLHYAPRETTACQMEDVSYVIKERRDTKMKKRDWRWMVNINEVHVKYQKRKNQKYSLFLMSDLRPLNSSVYFSRPYFNYKDLEPEREEGTFPSSRNAEV